MKKNILRYAAAAVAATAALACSKDDAANPGNPENPDTTTPFTITATIDDGAETRITMDDDGTTKIALKWKTGDLIFVVNDENGGDNSAEPLYKFTAQSVSADGKTAVFNAPANYTGTPAYASHTGTAEPFNFFPKTVSVSYRYSKNPENVPDFFKLYARYDPDSRKLVFKPLCALLKLIVTLPQQAQGDLGKLSLAGSDGTSIFYKGSYNVTQDPFARTSTFKVNKLPYSFYGTGSFAAGETVSLYIPLNPGTDLVGKSIVITLPVGGVSYTATITGGDLQAGKCYPLTLPASKWTEVQPQ